MTLAASDAGRVRLYLVFSNGDSIDEVSLIEKDDILLLAFDGGACVRSSRRAQRGENFSAPAAHNFRN